MSEDPLPTVSVVVPTYNRSAGLTPVLLALLGDPTTLELVVVDDGSTDGTADLLRDLEVSWPRLRPVTTENRGGAAARQHGIDIATGDVVLLLDDDVLAAQGLVSGHARLHAQGPSQVVLGYMPTKLPTGTAAGRFATFLYAQEYEKTCDSYERDPREILLRLWGGNVSLRREDLAVVPYDSGPFSRTNHSDRDFGIRCLKAGLAGRFDRSLLASHEHHRPLDAFLRDARKQGAGRYGVHQAHGDVLEPFGLEDTLADLPGPVRSVLALDRWRPVGTAMDRVLRTVARTAGGAGLFPVERGSAKLARRLEMRAGVREAMADSQPSEL